MKPKELKVVYCQWVDAVAQSGWTNQELLDEVHLIESIGFVVKENKDSISLAAAASGNQCNAIITIPKPWIRSKKIIKLK